MARIIECQLCPRKCRLADGERGDCRVRVHLDGKLQSLVYGNPCAVHVDPIEKKPLFHVLPASGSFSTSTLQPPDATFTVSFVKTGKYHSGRRRRLEIFLFHLQN